MYSFVVLISRDLTYLQILWHFCLKIEEQQDKGSLEMMIRLWQNLLGIAEQAGRFTADQRLKNEAKPCTYHYIYL